MRWVLIFFVTFILIVAWVASFFVPDLRWFAEVLTAAVVLPIVGLLVFFWVRGYIQRAAAEKAAAGPAAASPDKRARPEITALRAHVRGAVRELRRVLGGRAATGRLPWYIAIGPVGAGTSTMLDRLGLSAIGSGGAARPGHERPPCDLRSSRDAVVVDVPSRLADEGERDTWLALLDEIRRARWRRSIEGAVVTVSVPGLLSGADAEVGDWAARARAALEAAVERYGVSMPVYLVLTKADALPGFAEFWANDPKSNESTWGASFAVDDERAVHEPGRAIEREVDLLANSLHARMLERVSVEPDAGRRVRVLRFPLELRAITAPLSRFVDALCRPGAAPERFLFRGFYLTSAAPSAQAIDPRWAGARPGAGAPPAARGHFLTDVLRSVILPDRYLAAPTARSLRLRSQLDLRVSLIAVGVAFLILAPALASYIHNVGLAQDVQTAGEALAAGGDSQPGLKTDPIEPALDTLARVEDDAKSFGIAGWVAPRAALELEEPLRDAYLARIRAWMSQRLKPSLDKELEDMIGATIEDRPTRSEDMTPLLDAFETVRLFAALVSPRGHANGERIAKRLAYEWRRELGAGDVVAGPRLVEHARRYLAALEQHPQWAWSASQNLAEARKQLKKLGVQNLPFHRLLLAASDDPPIRASSIFAASSLPYLKSRGSVQVDGAFTANAWTKVREALKSPSPWSPDSVVEPWAIDDPTLPVDDAGWRVRMHNQYFTEYAGAWMQFLCDTAVVEPADVTSAKGELVALKEADGFYRTLFTQFRNNVIHDEVEGADGGTWFTRIKNMVVGSSEPDAGRSLDDSAVEIAFHPILVFSGDIGGDKAGGPSGLDKYLAILDSLGSALDEPPPSPAPANNAGPFVEASRGVQRLIDGIVPKPVQCRDIQDPRRRYDPMEALLKPPVKGAVKLGVDTGHGNLSDDWHSIVYTAWHDALAGHFPFSGAATINAVKWDEMKGFFKADGTLWKFVGDRLSGYVEQTGQHYSLKRGADPVSPMVLAFLSQARELSDGIFPGTDSPGVKFSVQADWTSPDVHDTKFVLGGKDTPLPRAQWSVPMLWVGGDDARISWSLGTATGGEYGRAGFPLFDLFARNGGLHPTGAGNSLYSLDVPPLTLKIRPEGAVDVFRANFFTRMQCPPDLGIAPPH
jgi:type VI secretion system protein ImpL